MSQLLSVRGGRRLEGEVTIQGAKNSVLPILAATLLARGQVALLGCPRLRDVDASIRILRHLGCDAHWEADALAVDTTALRRCEISDVLMREMRSSAIFLGAILARCGQADLSYPGGCALGPRPIDLHLAGLRDLGAEIREEGGFLHCRADRLRGREVVLRMPSVGATENLMLAACGAEGVTVISNAAREPEVVDLQNFLNACGARVSGAGSSAVSIEGGQDLHGCTYRVMPDRIAAATYLCAAASAGGDIYLRGAEEGHLSTVTAALREAGCTVTADSGGIRALCRERLRAVGPVQTAPYPGFPTDAQAVLMAALLLINIPLWIWLIDWVWIPILITVASAVFYLLIVNFYRSPHRNFTGDREDVVVASADGRVVALEEVYEPEYLKCRCIQLSVFMSPTNVHANWFPVDGEVIFYKHHPGRFMAAYLPKSSTENERSTVVIRTLGGQLVLMRQVAGAMARRVVTYARPGDEASIEDHMGFIKLGSRVDLYLPLDTTIKVNLGDKTVGGITEVGRLSHADDKPAN